MPVLPRQLPRQLFGDLSEALQSRISTASVDILGPTSELVPTTTQDLPLPSIPVVGGLTSQLTSLVQATSTPTIIFTSLATTTSATPTTTAVASTTPLPTSIEIVSTSLSTSSSSAPSLTTPAVPNDPDVIASTSAVIVTQSRSTSASATATGASSNADSTQGDGGLGSGIIALIVIGALLGALLAAAFVFRRVQVRRRAKRREINYGSAVPDNAPFPFTNVSEADLKGAQSIRDPVANYEKPLPSIIPDVYPAPPDPAYNHYGQYGDNGMSGAYPTMGGAAMGYGYEQPGRVSPVPSHVHAARMASPSPPPAAYVPGPYVYPQAPTPAPAPAPAPSVPVSSSLAVPQTGGSKKRVIQTFQPTLPDELDIQEGDWVTVLHAYDDGWGLCECNGRRGVVPLECLDPGKPDFRASRRLSSLSAIRQ